MSIEVQVMNGVGRMAMAGRFDFQAHREFKEAYSKLLDDAGVRQVEIELGKVDYIDSSALGMLMLLNERAKAASKAVALVNPSGTVAQVLDIANFKRIFTIR